MKKLLAMLLVLLMLASMLLGCQSDPTTNPSGSSTPDDTGDVIKPSESNGESEEEFICILPEDFDYGGQEVSILSWKGQEHLTFPTEPGDGSDPIQEALYYHWLSVEESLNVDFVASYESSHTSDRDQWMTTARAEDAAYDLMQTQTLYPTTLAQEGRLVNLRNLSYPDLEMPWWPESVDEWTQYGALFYIGSNSSAGSISNINVIFANIPMMEEEGLGDPVKLVLRDSWTVEEMLRYSRQFAGLAEANPGEIYGVVVDEPSRLDPLYYGCGFNSTRNNANGVAELAFDNEEELEKISNCVDQFVTLFSGVETKIHPYGADIADEMYNGQTAMLLGFMHYIRNIEDTTSYAPIPFPKLDADQKAYRIVHRDWADVWCIPISTTQKEVGGVVLETMASSEYRTVAPFYFEQYLKRRYATDADGMKCFDLLRNSIIYDFGRIGQMESLGIENIWRLCFYETASNNLMSNYYSSIASKRSVLETTLKNYEQYKNQ